MGYSFIRKILGLVDFHEDETDAQQELFVAPKGLDVIVGGANTGDEATKLEQKQAQLPTLIEVQSHVRRWTDENFTDEYATAVRPYYTETTVQTLEGEQIVMERNNIMALEHVVEDTGQIIHNIGTQHDRNPYSLQNIALRAAVVRYMAHTPPEQRHFILEGFNVPEGQEIPQLLKDRIESLKLREHESEEEAYQRIVGEIGEQGIGLLYALQHGASIDYYSEIPMEGEIAAFKAAGLTEAEIAATLLPKYLDSYRKGNEFRAGEKLTPEQVDEAVERVINVTGWKREELAAIDTSQRAEFVRKVIAEANAVLQKEVGRTLLSEDYQPQFKFANELAALRDRSPVANQMFQISNDTRDVYVTGRAYKAVQEGKSPFLIFGDSHTYKIDPALTFLAENTKASAHEQLSEENSENTNV